MFRKAWTKSTDVLFCFLDENCPVLECFQEETETKMITGRTAEGQPDAHKNQ